MRVSNNSDISLVLAVWLLHDDYDYTNDKKNYISATALLKSTKQTVLSSRIPYAEREEDVGDYIASSLGHAIHDSIEKAWRDEKGRAKALKLLGYPEGVADRIVINPTEDELHARNDIIPIYIEQRAFREIVIDGVTYTVGGKFDMIADGILNDHKSTSAFAWLSGSKDDDHRDQTSIYRWLNPTKVVEDHADINYIFTDWSRAQARSNPKYPQKRVEKKKLLMLSQAATEAMIETKIRAIAAAWDKPEEQIPDCTPKELWQSDPVYKYYADPTKLTGRSTKNFDDKAEAYAFMASKGGKGVVITVPGEAKACSYCPAFDLCKQKDRYFS